jgi:hypothetical protein
MSVDSTALLVSWLPFLFLILVWLLLRLWFGRARKQPVQPVQLLFERAKVALIMLVIAVTLVVVNWAWPNAIRQALEPLKMLVGP